VITAFHDETPAGSGPPDGPNPHRRCRPGDPDPLELVQGRHDIVATVPNPGDGQQQRLRIWPCHPPRFERAGKAFLEVRRQIKKRVGHVMAWKNAAPGTPMTGTTRARSR
jgi:hypothetical protein